MFVPGPDPDLLLRNVDAVLDKGASYGEIRFHRLSRLEILVMNGAVLGISRETREGLAARALVVGGLGFASARGYSNEALEDVSNRVYSSAKTASRGVKNPIRMGPARLGRARYEVVPGKPLEDVSVEEKINRLVEAYKSLINQQKDIRIERVSISYRESVEEKIIVNSDGAYIESRIPRVAVMYNVVAGSEGKRANRWFLIGGSGGYEILDQQRLEETMSEDVESLRTALIKAGKPPHGVMDIVLSPEIVGLAVHESCGHPSEADRILGREAAQAGLSFRTFYKGDTIGSGYATVIDDPTIPGSYGFYLYDDEGVAAGPRILYYKGKLYGMLHNRETAAVFNTESNAAARAMDYRSEPIVRMANTYFKPGDQSFEELVEDIREGVYIKKYMEWNIDDIRWGQRYVGLEAYMIKNGRMGEPVRDVALEITTKDFYSKIDGVGKDLIFYAGTCGKGEPSQGVPVWFGGPHIRLRGVRI